MGPPWGAFCQITLTSCYDYGNRSMSLYRDLVETSFHTDLLYHQFVVLQGSNKNTIKSHWSIRRPLADASWPRRHAVPDGKTMNDNAPLSLWGNFRRVELWGCVCCTIICADLSPPPGWVVPETRDPLKPDDNFRRGWWVSRWTIQTPYYHLANICRTTHEDKRCEGCGSFLLRTDSDPQHSEDPRILRQKSCERGWKIVEN